jgi:hypothetical protein
MSPGTGRMAGPSTPSPLPGSCAGVGFNRPGRTGIRGLRGSVGVCRRLFGVEQAFDQLAFAGLERGDLLFDRADGEQFVDEDLLLLADAMGAVGGLVLDGRVPPGIVVDDGVGGGEVEAGAAGFEADEEQGDLAGLEALDGGGAVGGVCR